MSKLSIKIPPNEPFSNPRDKDSEWALFENAVKTVSKNIDIPMIINGKKVYSQNKIPNKNPSTGEVIGTVQQADAKHAQEAIDAALAAKKNWSELTPHSRIQKFRDLE